MLRESTSRVWATRVTRAALICAALLLWAPADSWSQANSATFHGTVTDPTGAVVPGVTVTLTNQNTGATMTQTTAERGDFTFTFVPVGVYTVRIEAPGFKTHTTTGITLTAGQQARQTFTVELGSVAETVNVEGVAPLVNTVSAEQLHTFESTQIRQLPLQNRNVTGILLLNAGVVPSTGSAQGVNMNGIGTNGTQWSLDGTSATGHTGASSPGAYQAPNLVDIMSTEGVQEVAAIKGVIPAEYENAIGGQVNVISKSGSNQWHGSLFENHRNKVLNARFQRLDQKPPLVFNQFGGSIGGPIKNDKIFVFGDYEGYREVGGSFVQNSVPTQALRTQLLNAVPAYKLALDAFPLPNQPGGNAMVGLYASAKSAIRRDNHFDARGDILLTSTSRLAVTYNRGRPVRTTPRIYIDDDRAWYNTLDRVTASYTVGRAGWVSETRFGVNRTVADRTDGFFSKLEPENANESFTGARRRPRLSTNLGFSGPDGEINHYGGPLWQISQKIARPVGRHFLKFGGDFHRLTGTRNNPEVPTFTYSGLDNLLNNTPSAVTATLGNGDFTMRNYEFGFFIQDDWRGTSKLTLNLGLRYDFYSNFVSKGKRGTPDAGLYNPELLSQDGNFTVGPFRPITNPFEHDPMNFGPRFGFAYNPDGQGKTALRGGFGVMFTTNTADMGWFATAIGRNIPSRQDFDPALISRFGIKYPMFNENFFDFVLQQSKESQRTNVFQMFDPKLQVPYTMQYSFDIQRQITPTLMLSTGVTGTRGVKLILFRAANRVDRITGLRPNPNLSQPYYTDNSQSLTYWAWQSSLSKRFSRKLSFDVNYTWSKGISNAAGDFGAWFTGENSNTLNQEYFDLRADRGPTSFDITHFFSAGWVYELPNLQRLPNSVRHVLGGWQASGIFRANTGLPQTATQSSSRPGDRTDYVGGEVVLPNYRKTLQYLNADAFQSIPSAAASGAPIRPGNAGRGSFRGPGLWNLDLSVSKYVPIHERVRMQIRADMFNALNHTNLSGLITDRNNAFFGQLLSTQGARIIQGGASLSF
jgi:outer membrane receptor protein involved in Fe transport